MACMPDLTPSPYHLVDQARLNLLFLLSFFPAYPWPLDTQWHTRNLL